jgi:hypothetical protein
MLQANRDDETSFNHRFSSESLIMLIRLSTIQPPFLALAVVTVLLSHDLIMTAGRHDIDAHLSLGHHAKHAAASSDDVAATCGLFEAVRTTGWNACDGDHMVSGQASAIQAFDVFGPVMTAPAEPGVPPDQMRAMLQVFLN